MSTFLSDKVERQDKKKHHSNADTVMNGCMPSSIMGGKMVILVLAGFTCLVTYLLINPHGYLIDQISPALKSMSVPLADSLQNSTSFLRPKVPSMKQDKGISVSHKVVYEVQEYRKSVINNECANARRKGVNFQMSRRSPIYNDDYKFIFCIIPKVAATSWKRVFLVLQGDVKSTDSLHHNDVHFKFQYPRLSSLSGREVDIRTRTYTKAVFVREPFHRILSAYRDKLEIIGNTRVRRQYGTSIIAKYRKNASEFSLKTGSDVTFLEFVKYLTDPETSIRQMNLHWAPMFLLADVCNMNYDIIGKFEELQKDALYVLEKINASHAITFPSYSTHATNSSHDDTYLRYYSTIPRNVLSRLYDKYKLDFQFFDYDMPQIIKQSRVP